MTLSGFLIINKPDGMTSHDVVNVVKRVARQQSGQKIKVGHAGTLDPMATGVLVVCLGIATRLSEYVMASTKTYQARVLLGVTTNTYDADGEITQQRDASAITRADVEQALGQFQGQIQQIPPMFSAIKQGGKKLYELARSGVTVEREARPVTIHSLKITAWTPPVFDLEIVCSAGTYIRSLAHDLGELLGVGAHLTALSRTRSGAFDLADALSLDQIKDEGIVRLISPADGLRDWYTVTVNPDDITHLKHGRAFAMADHAAQPETLARALNEQGELIAIVRAGDDAQWYPYKVFDVD